MVNSEIESSVDTKIIIEESVRILINARTNTTSTTFSARLKFERSKIFIGIAKSKIVKTCVKISIGTRIKAIIVGVCFKTEIDSRISIKVTLVMIQEQVLLFQVYGVS